MTAGTAHFSLYFNSIFVLSNVVSRLLHKTNRLGTCGRLGTSHAVLSPGFRLSFKCTAPLAPSTCMSRIRQCTIRLLGLISPDLPFHGSDIIQPTHGTLHIVARSSLVCMSGRNAYLIQRIRALRPDGKSHQGGSVWTGCGPSHSSPKANQNLS